MPGKQEIIYCLANFKPSNPHTVDGYLTSVWLSKNREGGSSYQADPRDKDKIWEDKLIQDLLLQGSSPTPPLNAACITWPLSCCQGITQAVKVVAKTTLHRLSDASGA